MTKAAEQTKTWNYGRAYGGRGSASKAPKAAHQTAKLFEPGRMVFQY
jgi:hypothetical protein